MGNWVEAVWQRWKNLFPRRSDHQYGDMQSMQWLTMLSLVKCNACAMFVICSLQPTPVHVKYLLYSDIECSALLVLQTVSTIIVVQTVARFEKKDSQILLLKIYDWTSQPHAEREENRKTQIQHLTSMSLYRLQNVWTFWPDLGEYFQLVFTNTRFPTKVCRVCRVASFLSNGGNF